jgi:outer membrane protein, multidrug efflux system
LRGDFAAPDGKRPIDEVKLDEQRSYYEVLEAQQQLYPTQNTLALIRRNRLLAYVQLYRALGVDGG